MIRRTEPTTSNRRLGRMSCEVRPPNVYHFSDSATSVCHPPGNFVMTRAFNTLTVVSAFFVVSERRLQSDVEIDISSLTRILRDQNGVTTPNLQNRTLRNRSGLSVHISISVLAAVQ